MANRWRCGIIRSGVLSLHLCQVTCGLALINHNHRWQMILRYMRAQDLVIQLLHCRNILTSRQWLVAPDLGFTTRGPLGGREGQRCTCQLNRLAPGVSPLRRGAHDSDCFSPPYWDWSESSSTHSDTGILCYSLLTLSTCHHLAETSLTEW